MQGAACGVAGGLLFSVGDIATKVATEGGARIAFAVVLVAGYVLGTSMIQIGYQRGAALSVAGIATLLTNALPIAAGTVLLDEGVPSGALGVLRVLAFAAVVAGAIMLARAREAPVAAAERLSEGAAGRRAAPALQPEYQLSVKPSPVASSAAGAESSVEFCTICSAVAGKAEIGPPWPFSVAVALANCTGRVLRKRLTLRHAAVGVLDHPLGRALAEPAGGAGIWMEKLQFAVRSASESCQVDPETLTEPVIASPGVTG